MSGWFKDSGNGSDKELEMLGKAGIVGATIGGLYLLLDKIEALAGEKVVKEGSTAEKATEVVQSGSDWLTSLGLGLGLSAGALGGLMYAYRRYLDKKFDESIQYVRIFPSKEYKFNAKTIEQFIASLHQAKRPQLQRFKKGNEWFQLYFICQPSKEKESGIIQAYFGYPKDRQGFIKEKLRQTFFGFDMKEITWYEVPILVGANGLGGVIQPENYKQLGLPYKPFSEEIMSKLLSHLSPNSAFSISVHPTHRNRMTAAVNETKRSIYKEMGFDPKKAKETQLPEDIQWSLKEINERQKSSFRPFDITMSVWQSQDSFGDIVYSMLNELNTHLAKSGQSLRLKETKRNPIEIVPRSYFPHWSWVKNIPFVDLNRSFLMSEKELANLLHFPDGIREENESHVYNRMESITKMEAGVKRSEFTSGIFIGNSLSPAQDYRAMYLIEEVLRKMAVLIGRTGSGKTALIHGMVRYLIEQRLKHKTGGLTIVDPKKEFAYAILTFLNRLKVKGLLTEDVEDLFEFYDVTSSEYTFGLNPMQKRKNMSEQDKHEMARSVIGVLKSAFPGESILAEKFGELAVKCLLEDPKMEHTILAIADFIDEESPLRDRLYVFLKNGDSYQQRLAKNIERLKKDFGKSDIKPLLNRLHRLAENPLTRKIFGLKKTTINPLEIMEKGKIVLFNTEGLEASEIRLVVGYVLTEYHAAANVRNNTAETHFLIIDEAHEIQPPVLHEKILPKDRAFGLSLILMTQFLDQFNEDLLLAITENVGTVMSAAAGKKSAKVFEDITTGRVKREELQNLKSLTAIIDTEDSKGKKATFLVKAEPPYIYGADGNPTFYSKDDPQRTDREKAKAFQHAWDELGSKWMARDGRLIADVEKELEEYALALTNQSKKDDKENKDSNVVDMSQKIQEKNQKENQSNEFGFGDLEELAAAREDD